MNSKLSQFESTAERQILTLQSQLEAKEKERQEQASEIGELKIHLESAEQLIADAEGRVQDMKETEDRLNEKIASIEKTYAADLQKAAEKELELQKYIQTLSKELQGLKIMKESQEQELKGQRNLTQEEISLLRSTRRSLNESNSSFGSGSAGSMRSQEIARLQSEADSLRSVLELKQNEISKLSKQNEELLRDAEQRSVLQNKISVLESSKEMLQSELQIKSEKER